MSTTRTKVTTKNPAETLAHKRLSVLQLAEALGNVSEACRCSGMDRTSFYAWKQRFQEQGLDGLKDMPPVHHSHPQATAEKDVQKVIAQSLERPTWWGCVKISDYLNLQGVSISSPTVQKILICNGLATRYDRLLKLEERHLNEGIELSADQLRLIEKMNPAFSERHVESSQPGELLSQDTKIVDTIMRDLSQNDHQISRI